MTRAELNYVKLTCIILSVVISGSRYNRHVLTSHIEEVLKMSGKMFPLFMLSPPIVLLFCMFGFNQRKMKGVGEELFRVLSAHDGRKRREEKKKCIIEK